MRPTIHQAKCGCVLALALEIGACSTTPQRDGMLYSRNWQSASASSSEDIRAMSTGELLHLVRY